MMSPTPIDSPTGRVGRPALPDEILAALTPLPRVPGVRALHLPPSPWNGHRDAEFAALELADGTIGLAYVLLDDTLAALTAIAPGLPLSGADPRLIARWWTDHADARRVIGFAAVNALTRWLFDRAGYVPPRAGDSIGELDPGPDDHVGMVGLFPPLIRRIVAAGARLTVLELKPKLAGGHDGYRVVLDPGSLGDCNKLLATSTLLLNGTLDRVLAHAPAAERIALIGPGASCLPDPMFARGVTLMGGTWVDDGPRLLAAIAAGTAWGEAAHKTALTPRDYPGLSALRAALAG
ncbi:MAG: DUF364 domain-containing protein [Burkholderiaceae bacterium]